MNQLGGMSTLVVLWMVLIGSVGFFTGYLVEYQSNLRTLNTAQVDLQRTGEERDDFQRKYDDCTSKIESMSIEYSEGGKL